MSTLSLDPAAERTATDKRPAILMLTYISPLEIWGSAKRSAFLIEGLREVGDVAVLVIKFVDASEASSSFSVTPWRGINVMELQVVRRGLLGQARFDLTSAYVTREVARHVDLRRYDLLVSRYVKPALKVRLPSGIPLLVDFDDAVYEPPWRALHGLKRRVGAYIRLFNDRFVMRRRLKFSPWRDAHYFFCRDAERNVFPWLRASLLPNLPPKAENDGVPDFTPPGAPALIFVGLLHYPPNRDAVDWFVQSIWPLILNEVPEARFLIVGSSDRDSLARWRLAPHVEALGFVESLTAAYVRATACVVPMRSGAGTNIKALEPYLYGRMVVATPRVVDGHRPLFVEGQHVLVASDEHGLARHCVDILRDPQRASNVARMGYERIKNTLTEERFRLVVRQAVSEALTKRASPPEYLSDDQA